MCRLREGRANTARGAAHFLRETVGRVRYGGASGQLTVRADSGFYTHSVVSVCCKLDVRFSITIRQHKSLRNLIEAIPEADWTPIPYWMDGAADVAETTYTPFQSEPDAAPVRLIVRRVKPTPGSQLALFATYSYHGFITDRDGETLELEAEPHAAMPRSRTLIRDLKYGVGLNHMPSGRFAANAAWLAIQVMAHNLARWTARTGLGEQVVTTNDPPAAVLLPRRTNHPGPPPHPASSPALALGNPIQSRPGPTASTFHSRPDGAVGDRATHRTTEASSPQTRATLIRESSLLCILSPSRASAVPADGHRDPVRQLKTVRRPPIYPNGAQAISPSAPSPPFRCPHAVHRWIRDLRNSFYFLLPALSAPSAVNPPPGLAPRRRLCNTLAHTQRGNNPCPTDSTRSSTTSKQQPLTTGHGFTEGPVWHA